MHSRSQDPLGFYNLCQKIFSATDDPPRPSFDSQLSRDMAGYMPARADFMEVSAVCFLFTGIHFVLPNDPYIQSWEEESTLLQFCVFSYYGLNHQQLLYKQANNLW